MVTPFFLFAHGAGASSAHPWMRHWCELLRTIGAVETFDYPYLREGRKYPDPLPKLVAAHREALAGARLLHRGPPVLIGKSMGSRVGFVPQVAQPGIVEALIRRLAGFDLHETVILPENGEKLVGFAAHPSGFRGMGRRRNLGRTYACSGNLTLNAKALQPVPS